MKPARLFALTGALAALVFGVWAGLLRLGLALPVPQAGLPLSHAALLGCGFFGALIALERAVAHGAPWSLSAPCCCAAGTLLALVGQGAAALLLWSLGGLVLVLILGLQAWALREDYVLLMLAAGCDLLLAIQRAEQPGLPLALALVAFLVLTIGAERLELSRVLVRPAWAKPALWPALLALMAAAAFANRFPLTSQRLAGAGLLVLALWLARFDVIRVTIRRPGQPRFTALSLALGYAWLVLAAGLLLAAPAALAPGDAAYDAALHAVMVGFVLGMIFAHAPIILPALAGWRPRFGPRLYAPLALLQLSLLVRLAGDAFALSGARQAGGALHGLALLGYGILLTAGGGERIGRMSRRPPAGERAR